MTAAETTTEPRMGRPTKLTPELQAALVKAIRSGHSIASAAELVGIGERTIYDWRKAGEAGDATPELAEFAQALTQARAKSRDILISAAFSAAVGGVEVKRSSQKGMEEVQTTPPDGRIALELLARMFRDEWAPVKAVEITGRAGGPVEFSHGVDLEGLAGRVAAAAEAARAAFEDDDNEGDDL